VNTWRASIASAVGASTLPVGDWGAAIVGVAAVLVAVAAIERHFIPRREFDLTLKLLQRDVNAIKRHVGIDDDDDEEKG